MANETDVTLPSLFLETGTGGDAELTLPSLTTSADTGVSATGDNVLWGNVRDLYGVPSEITIDAVGTSGFVGQADLELPGITLLTSKGAEGAPELPAFTSDGSASVEITASANLILGSLVASIEVGRVGGSTLPAPTIDASGSVGDVGSLDEALPKLTIVASGTLALSSDSGETTLPILKLTASVTVGVVGTALVELPPLFIAANGLLGVTGSSDFSLPSLTVDASGFESISGSAVIVLPSLLSDGLVLGTAFTGVVIGLKKIGISEYQGLNFNSMVLFNGVYLAAGSGGIFELEGSSDNGVDIDAIFRLPVSDLNTSRQKRVPAITLGMKSDGYITVRVEADEKQVATRIVRNDSEDLHGQRVKLPRGPVARYWMFEIQNRDGSSLEIDEITIEAQVLERRTGRL